jgi:hypothetical protein
MIRTEANKLLDEVKDGKPHPHSLVMQSLFVCGDFEPFGLDGETISGKESRMAQGERIRQRHIWFVGGD